ncbi:MAG: hypothetical protein IPO26_21180 [Saprospiraceae bacterium]|nr:hypothetical protein [Saprospiraceae bacterium]
MLTIYSSYAGDSSRGSGQRINMPLRIYKNNILDYGGSVFQSSFDHETNKFLSGVNHDFGVLGSHYIPAITQQ